MARKTRKSSARSKSTRSAGKRKAARKGVRGAARNKKIAAKGRKSAPKRRAAPKRRRASRSPVARVKRVTQEVVQQATVAVSAGVETLRDIGENLADRIRTQTSS